jgi:hypothetical protein
LIREQATRLFSSERLSGWKADDIKTTTRLRRNRSPRKDKRVNFFAVALDIV